MNAVRRLEDFTDPDFDPFVADEAMFGSCSDPYVKLAQLRREGPVHALNYRTWMGEYPDVTSNDVEHFTVVGYDEVNLALRDAETFSNRAYLRNIGISFGRSVSTMDAPEHQRYRKIFQKAFLPNVVSKWGESVVDPVIDSLDGTVRQPGIRRPGAGIHVPLSVPDRIPPVGASSCGSCDLPQARNGADSRQCRRGPWDRSFDEARNLLQGVDRRAAAQSGPGFGQCAGPDRGRRGATAGGCADFIPPTAGQCGRRHDLPRHEHPADGPAEQSGATRCRAPGPVAGATGNRGSIALGRASSHSNSHGGEETSSWVASRSRPEPFWTSRPELQTGIRRAFRIPTGSTSSANRSIGIFHFLSARMSA